MNKSTTIEVNITPYGSFMIKHGQDIITLSPEGAQSLTNQLRDLMPQDWETKGIS